MDILFFCGSLEKGKDGVGDYTRKLAGELIRQGNEAAIIALNDKYIKAFLHEHQFDGDVKIDTLRLSYLMSWKGRIRLAKEMIENCNPEWLSLQFVPYSFHNKGLPFGLARKLIQISENRRWHIMFHELWLGIKRDSPFSHLIYKSLQKYIVRSLNNKLHPAIVHTSNIIYQLELKGQQITAQLLPLFSNIPLQAMSAAKKNEILSALSLTTNEVSNCYFVVVFGGIHAMEALYNTIKQLSNKISETKKRVFVIFFGRHGYSLDFLLNKFSALSVKTHFFGEVSELYASYLMQIADVALSCTPEEYISKSGVYAALRAHGLPVIQTCHINILQYQKQILAFNKYLASKEPCEWQVSFTTKKIIDDFSLHTYV